MIDLAVPRARDISDFVLHGATVAAPLEGGNLVNFAPDARRCGDLHGNQDAVRDE
jgi:hypothetical protein